MIELSNDGPRLVSTTYWSTEHAQRGLCYLSVNAGALRLLAPLGWPALSRAKAGTLVDAQVIGAQLTGVCHLVVEDGSDEPPYLTLDVRQCDRALPAADLGREIPLLLYEPRDGDGARLTRETVARIERAGAVPR